MDFLGLLWGIKATSEYMSTTEIMNRTTNIDMSQFTSSYSSQITSTYAPQISIQNAPQIMLGSPYGQMYGGAMQMPSVSVLPSLTPTITPTQTADLQEAPMSQAVDAEQGGGASGGWFDNIIMIGVLAAGAYLAYTMLMRPKSKKRDVKVALK